MGSDLRCLQGPKIHEKRRRVVQKSAFRGLRLGPPSEPFPGRFWIPNWASERAAWTAGGAPRGCPKRLQKLDPEARPKLPSRGPQRASKLTPKSVPERSVLQPRSRHAPERLPGPPGCPRMPPGTPPEPLLDPPGVPRNEAEIGPKRTPKGPQVGCEIMFCSSSSWILKPRVDT